MKLRVIGLISALLVCSGALASAAKSAPVTVDSAAQPIPAANENRIIRFTYSPDVIFRILTTTAWHTHIELADDEGITEIPMLGETRQWRASGGPRNIYVKPLRENLETSLTLVTNKRTYQFQLIGGKKGDHVYQKVSFDYPDREAEVKLLQESQAAVVAAETTRLSSQIVQPNVDPTEFDFGFEIIGNAPFRPLTAYSDGKSTYLPMPTVHTAPAVFLLDDAGNASLVQFTPKKNLIIVERVVSGILLKVGSDEVRVMRRKKSW